MGHWRCCEEGFQDDVRRRCGAIYSGLGLLVTAQCPFGRRALAKGMEIVDLFEETQVDKKPNEKNIQMLKPSNTPSGVRH